LQSASRSAGTVSSIAFAVTEDTMLAVYTNITAITGSLVVKLQEFDDQGQTWIDSATSTSLSTTGGSVLKVAMPGTGTIRVSATVTTGPVAFSVALRYSGTL
jgi:hypothetical protein